jgi:hypothetical protein
MIDMSGSASKTGDGTTRSAPSRRPGARFERGCLTVFALPFAAVGLGTTGWLLWTLLRIALAQSWVETPAHIIEARLSGGDTHRAEARYVYVYNDQEYEGTRVSFYGGSDNIGAFQQDVHRELSRYAAAAAAGMAEENPSRPAGSLFRCYVNPRHPAEAVLYRNVRVGMTLFQLMFAVAFSAAGFGLLFGSRIAARLARKKEARARQFPGEPWKWRDDWACGVLRADRSASRALLIFAIVWNAIAFPSALIAVPEGLKEENRAVLFVLIFPAVGIVVAVLALRELARSRRFGGATLRLATVPCVIGGKLAGVIQLPTKVQAESGFRLKLACTQTVTTGSGKNRHTVENVIWEDEQLLAVDAIRDPASTALPVLFAIPFDQPQTDPEASAPIAWRLEVSARNPGVDLSVRFELPVFMTPESSPDFTLDRTPIQPYLAEIDPRRELREAGVRLDETVRGTAFIFPPARFIGQAVFITIFALVWTGAVAGMLIARAHHNGPPLIFPIVFGFFDVFILWGFLDAWFGCGRIDVERGTLRWRKGLFGFGSRGEAGAGKPIELVVVAGSQSGTTRRYNVALAGPAWRHTPIGRELPGKRAAEILMAEVSRALRGSPSA